MEDTNVEVTEEAALIAFLEYRVQDLHKWLFQVTYSEAWKGWDIEDQKAFRALIQTLFGMTAVHKEKFDADVWKGHANGTVSVLIQSIRQERTGDKPGKTAAPITPESILAKRLKK
jgi:hypothetical protein